MTNTLQSRLPALLPLSTLALFSAIQANAASLAISQVPLYLGGTVEPNIMFVLDDSGSMDWSFMPDDIYSYHNTKRAKSSYYNKIYYDPTATYLPPLDQDGVSLGNSSFTAAWKDGYSGSRATNTVDLSSSFRPTWYYAGYSNEYSASAQAAFYYVFDSTNSNCNGSATDDDCYDLVRVSATSGPGGTDERTNFANWYSYYRDRMSAAKAGVSRAFAQQGTGLRIGYGRINKGSANVDGLSTSTLERGVRDFSDKDAFGTVTNNRKQFFDWLFAQQPTGNTPLRRALDAAGDYYEWKDSRGAASTTPGISGGKDLSCRQNFTILTTDGYWNSSSAATSGARQNNDGNNGPTITGPNSASYQYTPVGPFKDNWSDSLADIAMYYWNRDLRSDLDNNVPVSTDDPAFWQHMVTFGVGLGVEGTISPSAAFAAIATKTDPGWPDPNATNPAKIDDLLHASLNGRGEFFSAKDPQTFANALAATLATINARTSSAATVSASSTRLSTDTLVFQALFDSGNWSGDMLAFEIDQVPSSPTYLQPKATPKWQAKNRIPAFGARSLFTYNASNHTGIGFSWANLNSTQQAALGSSMLLDWIRGDQSREKNNGGTYRNRKTVMGDVINSSPTYASTADYGYGFAASLTTAERSAYRARRASSNFINREGILLFGGNDGIFRGLDGASGTELFGYVPDTIIPSLPDLADPDYTHRYYVDGSPRLADALIRGNWRSVVISSTGAGGKGYFALMLDNVLDKSIRKLQTSDILWEISNTTTFDGTTFPYAELGHAIGQAAIGRTESGQWVAIIGNGYNSTSQTARLFVIDLETGKKLLELDTKIGSAATPTGLATPLAVDADQNGSIDLVYAGDIQGNLWKFDFTSKTQNSWKIAFSGKPLFQAHDASNNSQPITTKPTAGFHPDGGLMLYFGTGKYFETGDNTDISLQSLYAVRDECGLGTTGTGCNGITTTSKVTRGNLLQQTIDYQGLQSFSGNSWEIRQFSKNQATTTHRGFYVDLAYQATFNGERVLATPILWSDRVIFITAIPDNDVCAGGGDSWIIELSPFSGGRTDFSVFDLAKDGSYGNINNYNNKVVSGRKIIGGMIGGDGGIGQIDAGGGKRLKIGSTASGKLDTSIQQSDGSQRISWRQIQ
ncbi:pilus assembly protein [Denitromonas sp.]|uniref:pilus assembly protein n=1 Tax=Denitromonas sp. TaxID=2734609 RepID=UPI003A84CF9C